MRLAELRDALRQTPFEPFRIHLTNGMAYDVRHPDMALVTRHNIHVVESTRSGRPSDRVVKCDLIHVVALEPLNGRNGRRRPKRPRRRH